jgi:hypothetical protein
VKSDQSVRRSRPAVGCSRRDRARSEAPVSSGIQWSATIIATGGRRHWSSSRRRMASCGRGFGRDVVVVAVAAIDRLEEERSRFVVVVDEEDDRQRVGGSDHGRTPWRRIDPVATRGDGPGVARIVAIRSVASRIGPPSVDGVVDTRFRSCRPSPPATIRRIDLDAVHDGVQSRLEARSGAVRSGWRRRPTIGALLGPACETLQE